MDGGHQPRPGSHAGGPCFHPYFPGDDSAVHNGPHPGEWETSPDGLPLTLVDAGKAVDWWQGATHPDAARLTSSRDNLIND